MENHVQNITQAMRDNIPEKKENYYLAAFLLHEAINKALGKKVCIHSIEITGREKIKVNYCHFAPLTKDNIYSIEDAANAEIIKNHDIDYQVIIQQQIKGISHTKKQPSTLNKQQPPEMDIDTNFIHGGDIGILKIECDEEITPSIRCISVLFSQSAIDFINMQLDELSEAALVAKCDTSSINSKIKHLLTRLEILEQEKKLLEQKITRRNR